MHGVFRLSTLALVLTLEAHGQTSCSPAALTNAAKSAADVRHLLHTQSVAEFDPAVPPAIASQLAQFKNALAASAQAAFSCAPAATTPEQLQQTLVDALHANVTSATETVETRKKRDIGTYGSDLSVHVFQLFGRPKFFEVDFRYGVECGDDNLLLIFEAGSDGGDSGWQKRLRWDAPSYSTVGDSLGDFVLLTPLTGSYTNPTWRFLVAHGHPGCATGTRQSTFDLDLLSPTSDPDKPHVDWHYEHSYTQSHTATPRLSTTEDTVDFRIVHEGEPGQPASVITSPEVYRFHLTANGSLEPSVGNDGATSARPQP